MGYIGESIMLDFLVLLGSVLITIYAFFTYEKNKWTRRGISFSNIHPIFGNLQNFILRRKMLPDVIRDFYLEHKSKPFIGFFSFTQPTVMINDIELVKSVLVKDFNSFADRNFTPSESDPLEYHSIFAVKGEAWKSLRSKLSPTFTSGKLKRYFNLIDECAKALVTCIEKEKGVNGEVEMRDFFARYTTDVIASCAFGIEGNALHDSNSHFREMMRKSVDFDFRQNLILALITLFPSLVQKLNIASMKPDVLEFFRKTVWDTVEYRKKKNVTRNDFLDLMIEIRDKGFLKDDDALDTEIVEQTHKAQDLDGDKFVAQCFLFLAAGFDTSSVTMSLAMYEMALNPDIQKRVYEEIIYVLGKDVRKVSYESLQDMEYLHMVVQETLRKYPVLHFLERQVTRPYRLPGTGIELKRGDSVMIPVIGLHYDPELYPEPQRFDPERFSEEQRQTRPSCSFLGFGDGPRICIGMRLGYMQTKIGLIYTLLKYEISPCSATPIPIPFKNASPFSQLNGGIFLSLKERNV